MRDVFRAYMGQGYPEASSSEAEKEEKRAERSSAGGALDIKG